MRFMLLAALAAISAGRASAEAPVLAIAAPDAAIGGTVLTPPPPGSPTPTVSPAAPGAPARSPRLEGPARGSWYIGFGLGGGDGSIHIGNRTYGFGKLLGRGATAFGFNLRAGVTLTPKLLLGFDGGALAGTAQHPSENVQLNYYDLGVMYFPWERGLFLRGAAGRSGLVLKSDGPIVSGDGRYMGWNALAGAGYALWLGKAFNLTANVDYQVHRFSSSGSVDVKGGEGWSAWLGFDWY